eukprot:6966505-Alexandrium_andersonii.AAC.1
MSASLVGSEMCIRDSARTPPETTAGTDHCVLACGPPGPTPHLAHSASGCCLLYTSDAADDM